ncbi:MAG: hypothetical protein KKG88_06600 [Proteobacteria bacterium]|jgi:hypothetical protein|nr:hypothetical protein [Pseudomonadota bacterium]MCG2824671.1 hypothetical protein [Desulfobulbaceae bacterium]MDP2003059.1 hypothetical protein [Desulfurivibrionaceae bacterium]PKN22539.1 MAG: hypothetical protein CVU68_03995 [Deltaproteobacteria bacterium HGW-Deltaproteobacteria-3]MBU4229955.1 hypothetical protein [Pseudomonadota bacterium]
MGTRSFDDLLQAFQSALIAAQDSLRIRREEADRRMFEAGEIGGVSRSSFFTFVIPQKGTDGDTYEVLPLPVSSFRAHHRPRISMLSLEFECELKEKRLPGASRRYSLVIVARNQRRWWHKNRRRMQIVFHGTDRPAGEVRIDGKLLVEIPRDEGAGKGCPTPEAKGSIFLKLINLLRNVGQQQRFTMTMAQSQRVREIVGQADAETMMRGETATWWRAIFSK